MCVFVPSLGEKPHQCTICDKTFYNQYNLKIHIENIHKGKAIFLNIHILLMESHLGTLKNEFLESLVIFLIQALRSVNSCTLMLTCYLCRSTRSSSQQIERHLIDTQFTIKEVSSRALPFLMDDWQWRHPKWKQIPTTKFYFKAPSAWNLPRKWIPKKLHASKLRTSTSQLHGKANSSTV